jgi:hypothetical protein
LKRYGIFCSSGVKISFCVSVRRIFINPAPVVNLNHFDGKDVVFDCVDDTIDACADAVSVFGAGQLYAAKGGVFAKSLTASLISER